jgi:hypothetical protein
VLQVGQAAGLSDARALDSLLELGGVAIALLAMTALGSLADCSLSSVWFMFVSFFGIKQKS